MAELDTIEVYNPLDTDFTVNFNGEPYTVLAGKSRPFPIFLALHIGKHLSDKMLAKDIEKLKKSKTENPFRPENAQLMIHDNPMRRKYLYDIFSSEVAVEDCIKSHPFKGFIGDMQEYLDYARKPKKEVAEKAPKGKSTKVIQSESSEVSENTNSTK